MAVHCVVQEGDLLCLHCETVQTLELPMALKDFGAKINAFVGEHRACPPPVKDRELGILRTIALRLANLPRDQRPAETEHLLDRWRRLHSHQVPSARTILPPEEHRA